MLLPGARVQSHPGRSPLVGEFDKGSAGLITHYGETLLALAGVSVPGGVTALANTVVLPTRVPDGILQANQTRPGEVPDLFLLEVATRGKPDW